MYKKTFFKILSILFIGAIAIYFSLNKKSIEGLANSLFNQPMNVTISSVTDTSFTVFWQTRTKDKSLLLVTTDEEQLLSTSSLVFDTSHQYLIDGQDHSSNVFYEIKNESSIDDLGNYTNHFVTINGLEANTTLYFAISNGIRLWKMEANNNLFHNNLENKFYYKVITENFYPVTVSPQPIVLSIDADNNSFDYSNSVVMIKKNNTSIYSYMSSSRLTVMDGSRFIKSKDTIDVEYFTSTNDHFNTTFTIDASDLDIDNRLISLKRDISTSLLSSLVSTVQAEESICCALQIENEDDFFGANYTRQEKCAEDNGVVIPNISTERACNITFTSVCCDSSEGYNWVPQISCPIEQVLSLHSESCFQESLDIKEYSIELSPGNLSFLLDFEPVYKADNNTNMNLRDILSTINYDKRNIHWIAAYDDKTSTWKYAVELANGQIVSNAFIPRKDTLIYYHSTDVTNFSIFGLK